MTPEKFLEYRLDDIMAGLMYSDAMSPDLRSSLRNLVESGREILRFHKLWLVPIEGPVRFSHDRVESDSDDFASSFMQNFTYRTTQEIEFHTREAYKTRFGKEPPTAQFVRIMLEHYTNHPDFDERWLS